MRTGALIATATAVLAGALGIAPAANAATTCSFDPTFHVLSVGMDTDGDQTVLAVGPSGDIQVRGGGPVLGCSGGNPTVGNTDSIQVVDSSDDPSTPAANDGDTHVSIIRPGDFHDATGPTGFILNLNAGSSDELFIGDSGSTGDHWTLGDGGINTNALTSSSENILTSTLDKIELATGSGNNVLSAQGGAGTGAPYDRAGSFVDLQGGVGADTLEGSENGDVLNAGDGDDVVRGFGGDDLLEPGRGNDVIDGGAGSDNLSYGNIFTGPVKVDLSQTGPQDTGAGTQTITAIENVSGTQGNDTLTGNAGPNRLMGGGGTGDTLDGGPGDDVLEGDGPNVTADYSRSPSAEIVDLVAQTATGGDGNDTLLNIANIVGTPFGDTLVGNDKPNKVTGGGGTDTVATLEGADTIDVRDGGPDTVACGTETDSVTADRRSVDQVNADCENVDALPEPPAPPPSTTTSPTTTTGPGSTASGAQPGGPNDTTLRFSLRAAHAQRVLRQKGLVLKVRCPDESCTAIVGTTGSLRGLRSGIRPATSRVAQGATQTLKVRLTRRQLRVLRTALRRHKRAALTMTVNAVDAAGNVVTRTVRVRVER